jgi:CDP-diacylglycerol--glycerol-3-phosphate 3-phosphatidyltransferase
MLTLYQFKPRFQQGLLPLVNQLAQWQVTPNAVTIAAILLSAGMGTAIACFPVSPWVLLSLPVVLLVRMALNAIDGMLARNYNLSTPLGCLLNELGDVLSDIALYLPFSLIPGISAPWIVCIVLLTLLTEMVGVLGQAIADRRIYSGPMGKSDRAFVFGTLGLLLGLGIAPTPWLTTVWVGIIGLQIWTIINLVRLILQEVAV